MVKLQYFALLTVVSAIGLNCIESSHVDASVAKQEMYLAQNIQASKDLSSEDRNSNLLPGDRNFLILAQQPSQQGKSPISEDLEMIETIQKRLAQQNINLKNAAALQALKATINNEDLANEEILKILREQDIDIDNAEKLDEIRKIVNAEESQHSESLNLNRLSPKTAFRLLAIGIPATVLVFLIATPFAKGTFDVVKSNYQKKFGKPPVPERSFNLHHNAFQEISRIARKTTSINDDKFGSEEFKILIGFKVDVSKATVGYKELNYKVELLRAAIIAQKSFLKLASTELRYRSRKQQEFYQYITDNLEENIDKEAFAKKIKKKQAELLPLINTEEGREAIHSYAREVNEISKYELGLKLLALFRKYDLKDFSVIRDISGIVEGLQGSDLLEPKSLVLTVKEYYDVFEKIGPILEISKTESTPAIYARILQIVGLVHRHGDAYLKFRELVRLLHKWKQPYETITMVREQYNVRQYSLPTEFAADIPGLSVYEQYSHYLEDLS